MPWFGIGDAESAVDEDFQLHVRAALANFGDFLQGELPGEDDPAYADRLPELDGCPIDGVRLDRQVYRQIGPGFADQGDEAGVGHDQGVGGEGYHRCHVGKVGRKLGVPGVDVADDVEGLALSPGLANSGGQDIQAAELVVAHSQ